MATPQDIPNFLGIFWPLMDGWNIIIAFTAIATVVINALLVVSIFLAKNQLVESQKSRNSQLLLWTIEQIERKNDSQRVVLRPDFDFRKDDDARQHAWTISVLYQQVGHFAISGLIDGDIIKQTWGLNFVRSWNALVPFVAHVRHSNKEGISLKDGAFSRKDFETFAAECFDYVQRRHPVPGLTLRKIEDADIVARTPRDESEA